MDDEASIHDRNRWIVLAGLTVLAIALRSIHLTRFSFWADECLTLFVCQKPLGDVFKVILLTDVHPPVYYVLLHLWQLVSHNEVYLRCLSLIPGVLSVPVMYALARRLLSERAALVAAALMAVNPLHVVQSQQIRYPVLVTLLSMLSILYFHRTLVGGSFRDAWKYVLVTVVMLYTNYVAIGVLLFEILWLSRELLADAESRSSVRNRLLAVCMLFVPGLPAWLIRDRPPPDRIMTALKAVHVAIVLFAVWVPVMLIQSGRLPAGHLYPPAKMFWYTVLDFTYGIGFWGMPRAGSRDAEIQLLGFSGQLWLFYLSLVPFLALLAGGFLKRHGGRWWTFEKACLAVVLPFAWIVCARSNIFQAKYALLALPAFLLVMAGGIDRAVSWRRWTAAVVALCYLPLTAFGLGTFYLKEMVYQERFREIARYLHRHKEPTDAILMFHAIARECVTYYADDLADVYVIPRREGDDQMDRSGFLDQMREIEAGFDRIWVVYYYEGHRDPGRFAREWFPIQFRASPQPAPDDLRDDLQLYEIVYRPGPDDGPSVR